MTLLNTDLRATGTDRRTHAGGRVVSTPVEYTARQVLQLQEQQFWCWGRDVEAVEGNVLLDYGFERKPKPEGSRSSSLYVRCPQQGVTLVLRGFGLWWVRDGQGTIFWRRGEAGPRFTRKMVRPDSAWTGEDADAAVPQGGLLTSEAAGELWRELCLWVASYETWIAARRGEMYRQETLIRWQEKHREIVPAADMADRWRRYAQGPGSERLTGPRPLTRERKAAQ